MVGDDLHTSSLTDVGYAESAAEIGLFYLLVFEQPGGGVGKHDFAGFEHVGAIGDLERFLRVLLDQAES